MAYNWLMIAVNQQLLFFGFVSSPSLIFCWVFVCADLMCITSWPCLFSRDGWLRFRSHRGGRGGCVGCFNELPASGWWIGVSEVSVCSTPSEGLNYQGTHKQSPALPTHANTQIFMSVHVMNTQQTNNTHNQCNNKSKGSESWQKLEDEKASEHHPEPYLHYCEDDHGGKQTARIAVAEQRYYIKVLKVSRWIQQEYTLFYYS